MRSDLKFGRSINCWGPASRRLDFISRVMLRNLCGRHIKKTPIHTRMDVNVCTYIQISGLGENRKYKTGTGRGLFLGLGRGDFGNKIHAPKKLAYHQRCGVFFESIFHMHNCALLALSVECNFGKFSITSRDNERKKERD